MLLAISDSWVIGLSVVNLTITVLLALGMFVLNTRTRRMETLESRLEEKTGALVEAQIVAKTGELSGAMRELASEIKRINQRLDDGDGSLDKLSDRDQRLEVMLKSQTGDLQQWMGEKFATKEDVRLLGTQVAGLGDSVSEISRQQAHNEGFNEAMARKGTKAV